MIKLCEYNSHFNHTVIAMRLHIFGPGLNDVLASFKNSRLPIYLAYSDIRQRYRRSSLGPFWITISMGVTIACIGIIFGNILKQPMSEFLPFLSVGLILWSFIATVLTEATTVFPAAEGIIRQLPIPLFSHIFRMIMRNIYILGHNILVLPVVYLCVGKHISLQSLFFIPGFIILVVNLAWMSLIISIFCARFRDLTQIIASILQIFFYITPIIWMPSLLPSRTSLMVLEPNPFYHLLCITRDPLLSIQPSFGNWMVSMGMALLGMTISLVFFNIYRRRIAYWI